MVPPAHGHLDPGPEVPISAASGESQVEGGLAFGALREGPTGLVALQDRVGGTLYLLHLQDREGPDPAVDIGYEPGVYEDVPTNALLGLGYTRVHRGRREKDTRREGRRG